MRWTILIAAGLLTLAAGPLDAQTIRGVLLDSESGVPVAGGTVTLLTTDSTVVTAVIAGDDGEFEIEAPEAGVYRLKAERIGYRASATPPIELGEDASVEIEYRLSTEAVVLRPLTVLAYSRRPAGPLGGFYERAERGAFGDFITREEIERSSPFYASDLLRTIPGVRLIPTRFGQVAVFRGNRCLPEIFLDGMRVGTGSIDDLVSPASLEGIEVYRSGAGAPAELWGPNSVCGTIALWTRRG